MKHVSFSALLFRAAAVLTALCTVFCGWLFFRQYRGVLFGKDRGEGTLSAPQTTAPESTIPVTEPPTEPPTAPEPTEPPGPTVSTVTMVAVGDNLIHNMVYRSGWGTDPWNYDHLYQYVKDDISAADIAVIDQETIFVADHKNVSHYPSFGTPREIGDAVYKAGFDVILHATNHVMDKGIGNVYDAIDYWSDKDVTVLGIHKTAEDAAVPKIVEKNGIRIGMINYTYYLNGYKLPADQQWAVDMLDNRDKLLADIDYLEENADITVAFLHMGDEYTIRPSAFSKSMVELVVSRGVDLCINGHPHVLEPYERYTAQNGNTAVVYYSLGNFVSAQTELDRLLGGMASLTITKTTQPDGTSVTEVTDFTMIPLVTHTANDATYAVYKLEDYTDELGARNVLVRMTTARLWKRYHEIVGDGDE